MSTRQLIIAALVTGLAILVAFAIQITLAVGCHGSLGPIVPQQFDVVVIGGGPGGYAAALHGALAGLNIAVVEKDKVGGTCLHRGCIPAKEFLETASVLPHRGRRQGVRHQATTDGERPALDFAQSQARKQKVVDQLWKGLQGLMKKRKITTFIRHRHARARAGWSRDRRRHRAGRRRTSSWRRARCPGPSPGSTSTARS